MNIPIDGLSESGLEPHAAVKRGGRHFREVPEADILRLGLSARVGRSIGCLGAAGLTQHFAQGGYMLPAITGCDGSLENA